MNFDQKLEAILEDCYIESYGDDVDGNTTNDSYLDTDKAIAQIKELIKEYVPKKHEWADPYNVKNTQLIDSDEFCAKGFNQAISEFLKKIGGEK